MITEWTYEEKALVFGDGWSVVKTFDSFSKALNFWIERAMGGIEARLVERKIMTEVIYYDKH